MVIAVLTVEYHLHGNDSLKGKRRVANSLKQKTRNKFNVAIAEDGTEDSLTLLRLAVVWNIPVACNRATADFMISSPLMSESYKRILPDFAPHVNRFADNPLLLETVE